MRIILSLLLLAIAGITLWNYVGVVRLSDIGEEYVGVVYEGTYRDKKISVGGVELIREWVETRTRPSWDFIEILRHQFWYNAVTEGYELKLWMKPETYTSGLHEYAIYQSGDILFYRIEFEGRNRVLITDFTVQELEQALEPYVIAE